MLWEKLKILDVYVGAHDCAQIKLHNVGEIVEKELLKTEKINTNVKIYDYIIMPNHVHIIINIITNQSRAQSCAPTKTIGSIIRGIKSAVSRQIGYSIWQRNYYEHVIRNENELYKIIEYIENNPYNWEDDPNFIDLKWR